MVKNEFDLIKEKKEVNLELVKYLEEDIFKMYDKNDKGHNISHILYVINRSIGFAKMVDDIDMNMVIAIASYHDCGHNINQKKHEEISGQILFDDGNLRKYFSEEQIRVMKEAVEDHRASLDYEPRSIYGKIVSSADRLINIDVELERTFEYRKIILNEKGLDYVINESRNYLLSKYVGNGAKTKMFFDDEEYFGHINELRDVICDEEKFVKRYIKVNNIEMLYYKNNQNAVINFDYMKWLEKFSLNNGKIFSADVIYNYENLSLNDMKNIASLSRLFELIDSYNAINGIGGHRVIDAFKSYKVKFNNVGYKVSNASGSIFCDRIDVAKGNDFIDFNDVIEFMNSSKGIKVNNDLQSLFDVTERLISDGISDAAIELTFNKARRKVKV